MTKIIFSLFVFSFLSLTSCERKGCMDVDALNYNGKAKFDDNSCRYSGNCIVWLDIDKQVEYTNNGISILYCYVDDELVGKLDVFDYTGTPPSCGSPKGLNFEHDLRKKRSELVELVIREPDSSLISEHTFTVEANECVPFKIPN